jgi:hypothetical protein
MARDILMTGQCVMKGYIDDSQKNYETSILDYGFSQLVTLSGTDLWSDPDNSTPFDDLKGWRGQVFKASGTVPNLCIM